MKAKQIWDIKEIHTFKQKIKIMTNHIRAFLSIPIVALIIVSVGCGGCGGVKEMRKENVGKAIDDSLTEIKSPELTNAESPLVFPSDFPKMSYFPDHLPKGEVIEDIISYEPVVKVLHFFDSDGKYLGNKKNSDFPIITKLNALRDEFISNDRSFHITEKNREKVFQTLNELGFNIPNRVVNKAFNISGFGKGIDVLPDYNIMKNIGAELYKGFQIFDDDNCTLGQFSLVKIFNFKGELERQLDYQEIGEQYQFTSDLNICFSTYWINSCGYEPDITIDHHRFSNFKKAYYYDFNPINVEMYPSYIRSNPDIIVNDSIVQLNYTNGSKFLRVVVEPYNKNIFYKLYDTDIELGGKFNEYDYYKTLESFKLPDGSPEEYKSYEILVPKK